MTIKVQDYYMETQNNQNGDGNLDNPHFIVSFKRDIQKAKSTRTSQ